MAVVGHLAAARRGAGEQAAVLSEMLAAYRSASGQGYYGAIEAGVHKVTLPVSASEAHSLANVRKTRAEMVDEVPRRRCVEAGTSCSTPSSGTA